jgi:hypothetical protein
MEKICKQSILEHTHYGLNIYSHILKSYYPDETVLALTGRTCPPAKNPFNADKPTLNIYIEKSEPGNVLSDETACHSDSDNAIPSGNVFDFAELHYKQTGEELLQTLNKELNLHLGEKRSFYEKKQLKTTNTPQTKSPPSGETAFGVSQLGGCFFSFFRSPITNVKPHKSISLLDAYNYIIGDFAKERTEKLRSISPLSCGEGSGERPARKHKAQKFDYCTFSGAFSSRSDKNLIKHSGLICLDFDHLSQSADFKGKDGLELLKNALLDDEYFETELMFISPSGDGLKWIIKIDISIATHAQYFDAISNYVRQTYNLEIDKACRDVSRACFLPHDPNAFINPLILKQNDSIR